MPERAIPHAPGVSQAATGPLNASPSKEPPMASHTPEEPQDVVTALRDDRHAQQPAPAGRAVRARPGDQAAVMNHFIRRAVGWGVFYGVLAALIVVSDHVVENVLRLNL